MHGTLDGQAHNGRRTRRQLRRRSPHLKRHHQAVFRAWCAAMARLGTPVAPDGLVNAAKMYASSINYVAAWVAIIEAEDTELARQVMFGEVNLLAGGKKAAKRAKLIKSYRAADPADRVALGTVVGADHVFDEAVIPAL